MSIRIGVDLGGTKIEVAALDGAGQVIARERRPTPSRDYNAIVTVISETIREIEASLNITGSVGVGIPGALSPVTGMIKNANTVSLIGKPFAADLSQALGRPIRLCNDANCFTLSEAVDGAATGAAVVFGVIIGTGTGGGIVVNRNVLPGINAISGEWGHNPLPWPRENESPGPLCYCGMNGCIETFISGTGMARDYKEQTRRDGTPPQIAAAAEQGDEVAEKCMIRYIHRLARSLATVINLLDPDVIVLGGGVSNIKRLYTEVPQIWDRFVFSDRVDTSLKPAMHGDSSGVRGAAWLWPIADERIR